MAAKHLMIAIDWFGPYLSISDARASARSDYQDGLYLAIAKDGRRSTRLEYIGISKNLGGRLSNDHHKLSQIDIHQIWLGEISTAEPSGKPMKVTKATLDYAEWLHAYFLQLPDNDKKRADAPFRPVTILNRWWKTDYETPRRNRPHPDWPNLIDHPRYGQVSRAVWFGGRQTIYEAFD